MSYLVVNDKEIDMKDTLVKLRALISMKTTIIKSLQEDIATANRRMQLMECRITELERDNPWWKPLDEEMGRIEQHERIERDMGECGIGKRYYGPGFFEDTETAEVLENTSSINLSFTKTQYPPGICSICSSDLINLTDTICSICARVKT